MSLLPLVFAPALAADLDLVFAVPDGEPVGIVFADLAPGRLPAVTVEGAGGASHRLTVEVLRADREQWLVELTVEEIVADRRGRPTATLVDRPWVWVQADRTASVEVGQEVPVARDGGATFERRTWSVDLTVRS